MTKSSLSKTPNLARQNSDHLRLTAERIRVFILIPMTVTALLFSSCIRNSDPSTETPTLSTLPNHTAYPMPPLNGKSLTAMGWNLANGKRNVFSDFKGQVLVLDFYATWCIPCRNSTPHLVELQNRYGKDGLRVVGLNVGGPEDLDQVPAFAEEFKIQYQLGVPDDDLNNLLLSDDSDIPQTFIFDRRGLLKNRFKGFNESTGNEIDEAVKSALQSTAD